MKTFDKKIPKITFVIPSRNNLDLLKLAYKSIRKKYIKVQLQENMN